MEKRPYHHLPDGTFRNPEGSPVRSNDIKFSYRTFIKEKKKIDITVPKDHDSIERNSKNRCISAYSQSL